MKARLIISRKCSRDCTYCCNKAFDVQPIKLTLEQYIEYVLPVTKETIITGGEPFESIELLHKVLHTIKENSDKPVYLYTQRFLNLTTYRQILEKLDGVTYTLHHPLDNYSLKEFEDFQSEAFNYTKIRLNINSEISRIIKIFPIVWDNIKVSKFIQNGKCPLPEDEVLFELI